MVRRAAFLTARSRRPYLQPDVDPVFPMVLFRVDDVRDHCQRLHDGRRASGLARIAVAHPLLTGRPWCDRGQARRLRGLRLCEPCGHLEKLTVPGVQEALTHRCGLRAEILNSGTFKAGDAVRPA